MSDSDYFRGLNLDVSANQNENTTHAFCVVLCICNERSNAVHRHFYCSRI